jgi:hypothetical protein
MRILASEGQVSAIKSPVQRDSFPLRPLPLHLTLESSQLLQLELVVLGQKKVASLPVLSERGSGAKLEWDHQPRPVSLFSHVKAACLPRPPFLHCFRAMIG